MRFEAVGMCWPFDAPGPPGRASADGKAIASVDIVAGRLVVAYTDGMTVILVVSE
jgi:hypothetical protein